MALLFDMDGLLLDTERVAMQAFIEAIGKRGAGDPVDFFMTLVGSSRAHNRHRLEEWLDASVDREDFDAQWHARFEELLVDRVPLKAGVGSVIRTLGERSVRMAVVTSTRTATARSLLDRAGLLGCFADVVGGDAVRANKPDPEPYLTGAARIGADPADCCAFEDSDPGVASATAAGCRVFQIPDLRPAGKPFPALGQSVFDSLEDAVSAAGWI